jgi:hypothetical protein
VFNKESADGAWILLGEYSGDLAPFTLSDLGLYVRIAFRSDSIITDTGFSVQYTSAGLTPSPPPPSPPSPPPPPLAPATSDPSAMTCSAPSSLFFRDVLQQPSASLTLSNYIDDQLCELVLTVPPEGVSLEFENFDTEEG